MESNNLRKGIIVNFEKKPVEVVSINHDSKQAEVRQLHSNECVSANCDDLTEDPQLHTDCVSYY